MVLLIHLRAIIVANMHHFVINSLDDSILNLNLEKKLRVEYRLHYVMEILEGQVRHVGNHL
jgi:hypothetical protein